MQTKHPSMSHSTVPPDTHSLTHVNLFFYLKISFDKDDWTSGQPPFSFSLKKKKILTLKRRRFEPDSKILKWFQNGIVLNQILKKIKK